MNFLNNIPLLENVDFTNPTTILIAAVIAVILLMIILKLIRKIISKGLFLALSIIGFGSTGIGTMIELIKNTNLFENILNK